MLTDLERRWVSLAREVITDQTHGAQCVAEFGSPPEENDGGGQRWPGYVGAGYRMGGLLCGGKVHTRFASAGLTNRFDFGQPGC